MKEIFLSINTKNSLKQHIFTKETQKKFPISDKVIVIGVWIDVENRAKVKRGQVQYFLDRYSDIEIVKNIDADKVYDEFYDWVFELW